MLYPRRRNRFRLHSPLRGRSRRWPNRHTPSPAAKRRWRRSSRRGSRTAGSLLSFRSPSTRPPLTSPRSSRSWTYTPAPSSLLGCIMVRCEWAILMPVTEEVIADLARRLIAAEQRCVPIEPITSLYPDLTEVDAYRIQMAVVATKVERGDRVTGRKVGATNHTIQQLLRIDEPIYGSLFQSNQVANGETISLSRLIHPRIECEIAFLLGADLVGPGIAVSDVLAATGAVMASLEINDPRTREWKIGSREAIADNGVTARFVLSEQRLPVEDLDLPNTRVVLKKNGEEVASATGAGVLGDPARAVAWLVNKLAGHHQRLKAGEIVLPGSMTPIYPVVADKVEAVFDVLGSVSVRFV